MKTKDFIKMLQEEDPTGECHVLLYNGTPVSAAILPGYYDGTYSYIDNGNFVISDKENKLVVYAEGLEDFIWRQNGDTSKVILGVYEPERFKASIEKYSREAKECEEELNREIEKEVLKKIKEGWKPVKILKEEKGFVQHWYIKNPKKFKEKEKKSMVYVSNKNQTTMALGQIRYIKNSGKFYQVKDEKLGLVFYEMKD